MRYFRTKDGQIIDFEKTYKDLFYVCETKQEFNKWQKKECRCVYYDKQYQTLYEYGFSCDIFMYGIINTADTIEELCDVIIYVDKYDNHEIIYGSLEQKKTRIKKIIKMGLKQGDNFYGAIWTDKGLIFVAKMNDKGELELL